MFTNLSIKARLIFILSFLAVLLLVIGIIGLSGISKTEAGLKTVYEDRTVPLGQVASIQAMLLQNRIAVTAALADTRPEFIAEQAARVESNIAEIGVTWDAYMATDLTPEEKTLADKFAIDRKSFVVEGLQPAIV
ncbi:MAG: histidine kinase, partial [Betaproteobacteria bacterium HGW-Betaproteobacteria-17]